MAMERKNRESFVLVYSDDRDPLPEETAQALDHLRPLTAEEVLPGTIRVIGSRHEVERCMGMLNHWRLSKEKLFKLNPPYKSLR